MSTVNLSTCLQKYPIVCPVKYSICYSSILNIKNIVFQLSTCQPVIWISVIYCFQHYMYKGIFQISSTNSILLHWSPTHGYRETFRLLNIMNRYLLVFNSVCEHLFLHTYNRSLLCASCTQCWIQKFEVQYSITFHKNIIMATLLPSHPGYFEFADKTCSVSKCIGYLRSIGLLKTSNTWKKCKMDMKLIPQPTSCTEDMEVFSCSRIYQ